VDKVLFDKYISIFKQDDLKNIGKTFLHGISGAETLASILILANKKFIIVADSDKTSSDKRKDFESAYSEYKECWAAYGDVNDKISTLEDFIDSSVIEEVLNKNGYPNYKYNNNQNAIANIENCTKVKEEKQKIKKIIVESITKKEDFNDSYIEFIGNLRKKLLL